jgi:hypothetical protein
MAITDDDICFLLASHLGDSSSVSALVGDRIRPDVVTQNSSLPAIRYELIAEEPWNVLSGETSESQSRVQFDCYAMTRIQANQLAAAVKNRLHGFSGSLGNIVVVDCFVDNQYDTVDPPVAGGNKFRKRRVMDFVITHTVPTPTLS